MFNYAEIKDGIVVGLQESDNKIVSPNLVIANNAVSLGDNYNNGKFTPFVKVAEKIRLISADAMRDRFTFDERVLVKQNANVKVQTFYDDLSFRKRAVNLDSPRFALAFALLEAENIITPERTAVLTADGSPDEAL